MVDENPTPSERKIDGRIGQALSTLADILEEMTDSAHTRELRAKARSYERVVAGWEKSPPSNAQREATFDLVKELHAKVVEARHQPDRRHQRR